MGYERNDRYPDRYRDQDLQGRARGHDGGRDRYSGYPGTDRFAAESRGGGSQARNERYRGNYNRPADYDYDERGFLSRAGDELRSWFGDEEAERRREFDHRYDDRFDPERERADRPGYGRSGAGRASGERQFGYGASTGGRSYGEHRDRSTERPDRAPRDDYRGSYVDWRERQNELFDRDYEEYQRENQSRFDSDFAAWRTRRETQRGTLVQAVEHMEVVGSDGIHVGTVDKVRGDRILLTKTDKDAGGHHHSIPSRWIDRVDDRVILEKTAEQAQAAWRDEEGRQALFGEDASASASSEYGRSIYKSY